MKKKKDETTVRVLEIKECGRCFYFRQMGKVVKFKECFDPPFCEEIGVKVKYAQTPPKSCPLPTIKDFVEALAGVIK